MLSKGEGCGIALDQHISTFKSDIISNLISCVQFTTNNYIQDIKTCTTYYVRSIVHSCLETKCHHNLCEHLSYRIDNVY